ncbi:unnamed protein product [Spirodela intermedia]|uniref:RRM domain-containing protein n=1 Tax=Spirodela intermedia TaxID=51605 RepID=A0A7I8KLE3_SPIIN|nr:unnamed protein product [Spirodela intermedia]
MADPAGAYHHHPPSLLHYPFYEPPATQPGALQQPPPPGMHSQYYPGRQQLPPPTPPPHGTTYSYAPLQSSGPDEVRTLFIAGLPDDVKPREIYNLFREFPGYMSCQVRCTGQSTQAFAFAVFRDQQSALVAMNTLNGMVFDLDKESTLFIDLAKSNSRSKRSRIDDGVSYFDKKVLRAAGHSRGFPGSGLGSNIHTPGVGNSAYNCYPSAQSPFQRSTLKLVKP